MPEVVLHFQPIFNGKPAEDGLITGKINGDSIAIHTLRFYLSNFVFYKSEKEIWREKDSYHLLDLADENSFNLVFNAAAKLDFDKIQFQLGTDSLANVSGAMGGDLDPTKGMYWAWNSGYVNFKIEGFSEKCPTRNHQFQFHIGGYLPPFQTVQTIELTGLNQYEATVDMELSSFFEPIGLAETHSIMSPSETAAKLAKLLSKTFRIHGQ